MRTTTLITICIAAASAACGQETAPPRPVEPDQELLDQLRALQRPNWTYAELAAKSDLIVIAKVASLSEIAWEQDIAPGFGEQSNQLIANRLNVLSVLKGEPSDEIDVITVAWRPDVLVLTNDDFVELRRQQVIPRPGIEIDGVDRWWESSPIEPHNIEPEYLFYLRRFDAGRYVPVTGQRYSALSVRMLND